VLVTFLLSGLWHGASWNYVLWGFYHGVLLLATRAAYVVTPISPRTRSQWVVLPQIAGMFVLTMIGWLLFRETELPAIVRDLRLSPFGVAELDRQAGLYLFLLTLLYSTPLWIQSVWVELHRGSFGEVKPGTRSPWPGVVAEGLTCGLAFAAILVFRSLASLDFIYFQF
jgi:hypothetical protein